MKLSPVKKEEIYYGLLVMPAMNSTSNNFLKFYVAYEVLSLIYDDTEHYKCV